MATRFILSEAQEGGILWDLDTGIMYRLRVVDETLRLYIMRLGQIEEQDIALWGGDAEAFWVELAGALPELHAEMIAVLDTALDIQEGRFNYIDECRADAASL